MKRRDEEEDAAYTFCDKCGEMFEKVALLSCSFCSKHFCPACNLRKGGKDYCSRSCWELMFFGDAEPEDEDLDEDDVG